MDKTGQNVQIFEEVLFFKLRTKKQQHKNKQLIQLILCQSGVGGWWKEKDMRLTLLYVACKRGLPQNWHVLSCFVRLKSILLISCVFWIFFQNVDSQFYFSFFLSFHAV